MSNDPMVRSPSARAINACRCCSHVLECRTLVNSGLPVLCAPVFSSDLGLAIAYHNRKVEQARVPERPAYTINVEQRVVVRKEVE